MSYIKTVHDWHVSAAMCHPLGAFQHCICWVTSFRWPMWVETCQGHEWCTTSWRFWVNEIQYAACSVFSLSFILRCFTFSQFTCFHLISFSHSVIDILFNRTCLLSLKYCHLMHSVIYFRVHQDDLVPPVFLASRVRKVIQENYHLALR
jgi:hypothetical protein